jgi:hypothetical protein
LELAWGSIFFPTAIQQDERKEPAKWLGENGRRWFVCWAADDWMVVDAPQGRGSGGGQANANVNGRRRVIVWMGTAGALC